jgi:hypothetical protein
VGRGGWGSGGEEAGGGWIRREGVVDRWGPHVIRGYIRVGLELEGKQDS